MGTMDFWKCEQDKFLIGVRGLSLEETGAYSIILNLIYATDNRLRDDEFEICGSLHTTPKKWRVIKETLVAKEKIYIEDGFIMNNKATRVIENALESSEKVSKLNSIKGQKSAAARKKNKELKQPPVEPVVQPKPNHIRDKSQKEESREEENNPTLLPDLPKATDLAVKAWNELVDWQIAGEKPGTEPPRIPKVQNLSATRDASLELRFETIGGFPGWAAMLEIIKQSPHLLGQNDRGWTVTFDWVLNPKNLTKIMEGNYVRKHSGNGKADVTQDAVDWLYDEAERRESLENSDDLGGDDTKP